MSFGGGFGGFGQTNQQSQNTGFGGFGASTNNTSTGFGASNTGFGSSTTNTGGGLFGGGNNTNTTGGFGSTGGFGATNNNAGSFGAKPAFGSTTATGGGLFGNTANSNTNTSGGAFGGFGSTNNNNQAGGFGASTGGGLFGSTQNKPAFGATTNTTGGGLFGGGAATNTATGFGQSSGGFGSGTAGFGQQSQTQTVNQGTAAVPFSAHSEKDTGTSANSHYQSISFMQPYQNFSFEELRVADYNAGRRFGNSNGQAGAFGQSTGFGGFGQTNNNNSTTTGGFGASNTNTGGGLFGSNNNNNTTNTSSPFGGQTQQPAATGGFGSGGGLFGQNKPASTGLFGSTPAASSGTTSGGLFGTANNTTQNTGGGFGGFGQQNNTATTGGGLFGNTAPTQAKPAFGGFGGTSNTTGGFGASNTGGFGQTNNQNTGGGLFGSNTANTNSNPFGGAQQNQQTSTGFGGFGQNNQNQTQQASTGGGLFGGFGQNNQNQQKPGGLFGSSTNTGGGLFGNANNQQNNNTGGGGLFGNNQNQNQSGGLFGAKPATGGTGLFGSSTNTTNNTGGGLFGNNNNQNQTQSTGLFGQNNNNNQPKPLFGGSTGNTGGGLFGGLNQQNNNAGGGGLFGNSQQQQNNGGLFGGSQQNQQQPQAQNLTASLMQNPYGNDQLFAGLGTPSQSVGPLATPLAGASKPAKRPQAIPAFKINPSASMRLITPQKRPNGYGFSYSTYGTPGSAQTFTPGRSNGLFGSGSLNNRQLSKSLSTSNLRSPLATEDSVHNPNAFTPNYRPYSSGSSIRRLKIDRSLRTDLFGNDGPERPTKRVSFDGSNATANGVGQANGTASPGPNNALVRSESDGPEPSSEELGFLRSNRNKDARTNGSSSRPDPEQTRGNELAIVPEDEQVPASTQQSAPKPVRKDQIDQQPGDYYMTPSLQQLRDMSREELQNVTPFTVGRVGIGKVEFSKVDLTTVPLDQILDDIVRLTLRSATVYESGANTPPQGKGLNVPSTITLENSWPRSNGGRLPVHERKGPRFDKHVERLKRVGGTQFVSYSPESGEWVFKVEHFTTYGLDDDDEEDTMLEEMDHETASKNAAARTTPPVTVEDASQQMDTSAMSPVNSDPDDTFDFKKSGKTIPGGFGAQPLFEDDEMTGAVTHEDDVSENEPGPTMLEDPFNVSTGSQGLISPPDTDDEAGQVVGAFPEPAAAPKSILKPTGFLDTPAKDPFQLHDNWAEQLQRTVSPRKQDRKALREQQGILFENGGVPNTSVYGRSAGGPAFSTTMDIMNSLWNQPKNTSVRGRNANTKGQGFEWPYTKRNNGELDTSNMSDADRQFHDSFKPRWTPDGTLAYAASGNLRLPQDGVLVDARKSIVAEGRDIRLSKLHAPADTLSNALDLQLEDGVTVITTNANGVPSASTKAQTLTFTALVEAVQQDQSGSKKEQDVLKLAGVLFDPLEVSCKGFIQGVPLSALPDHEHQIRREALLNLWRDLTRLNSMEAVRNTSSPEGKALACLGCGDVEGACKELIEGRNFHLATIVAQMPLDKNARQALRYQIDTWRTQNVLSEIPLAIRALYELAAGNAGVSEGKSGAAEDRAATFGISEQFNLSWQQALGLRLWYGSQDLPTSIKAYIHEISTGKEKTMPTPATELLLEDESLAARQDGLLVLLRLYASRLDSSISSPTADELFSPIALTGHPFKARVPWQLASLLQSKRLLGSSLDPSHLDSLTTSLALQLESLATPTSILVATTILSHLSTASLRETAITSLLTRRAPLLTPSHHPFSSSSPDRPLTYLTNHHIPAAWLHTARALLAASHAAYSAQAAHLLLASASDAAHEVLLSHVGPTAVISRDYDELRELLGHFKDGEGVQGWETGGRVYFDYIHWVDMQGKGKERERVAGRVRRGLVGLKARGQGKRNVGLEERVAVGEMGRAVTEGKTEGQGHEDAWARQGGKLWGLYGRALRVGG